MTYLTRRARFFRVSARPFFASLGFLAIATATPCALASNPVSFYSVPTKVDLLPNAASATEVVIHGAFIGLGTNATYGDPRCGVMYFKCAAGQEAMCRMQWQDIRGYVTDTTMTCAGFGALNMVSTAKIRDEGAPLGTPDAWDLGMGITPGMYVEGKCSPAHKLSCTAAQAADGGATGTGGQAGTFGTTGTGGATGTGGQAGTFGTTGTGGATGTGGQAGTFGTTGTGGATGTGG
ncbi:MAG TPA: hypothetical protein VFH73_02925, partial [Polyangia bacterium]|nr:hypothetical protein [Polyangia bacterium]